jgi:hypothetical protein
MKWAPMRVMTRVPSKKYRGLRRHRRRACIMCTRAAVNKNVNFEISVYHNGVVPLLGNTGYLDGKDVLQLQQRQDNHGLGLQSSVAVVEQRAVTETQVICLRRETRANGTSVAVIVANFVGKQNRTRSAPGTPGAVARMRVMLQGCPVTIAAVFR